MSCLRKQQLKGPNVQRFDEHVLNAEVDNQNVQRELQLARDVVHRQKRELRRIITCSSAASNPLTREKLAELSTHERGPTIGMNVGGHSK